MWHDFWLKSIDARQFAALRIAFGCLSVVYLVDLLPYVESQFSGSGWLGGITQLAIQNGGSWSLFFIEAGGLTKPFAELLVVAGIISAALLTIGWHSRLMAGLTWLVWASLWNRNPLLLDGDDAVLKVMCFYLLLSPCGRCWSLDSYKLPKPQTVAIWPLRLVQFQVALLYFVSGWVKFHSQEWLDGSVIDYVLIHPHYSRWDGWQIINNPLFKALTLGFAGIIRWWELLFPFLLLNRHSRQASLVIGAVFHLGLLFTMNLRWFAVIMLALYLALLPNECYGQLEEKWRGRLGLLRFWRNIG